MSENIIEFKNITKRFGGTTALDHVSFAVKKGQVTGLVGENGAGKSTLVKICGGVFHPDEGEIILEDKEISIKSPRQAETMGISFVHQELPICKNLNVVQNIFLGPDLPGDWGFPDKKYMYQEAKKLFDRLDVDIDPNKDVSKCSMGEQQLIMIARAISRDAKFILMDEPTTALSPKEVKVLYNVIDRLKEEGISVVFISHRLNEVQRVSDRICVLKDGEYVGSLSKEEASEDKIASMMVGRDVKIISKEENEDISDKNVLEVKNLTQQGLGLHDINLELKEGEILGIAGLRGAGRTELARSIIGDYKIDAGEILVEGKKVEINSPRDAIKNGIGYLPEDRGALGLFHKLSVRDNICMAEIDNFASKAGLVNRKKMNQVSEKYKKDLEIKMRSLNQNIISLSGGNQQKVLIARWLAVKPRILIMDEPTRGIDVGTKTEIRKLIMELVKQNFSIIMISSEMLEVMAISDRILVMSQGRISGE
ncbi:MAG: sugar ABC transporter ATP-binding protein, partial [Halanaerobiales bacterium]|nr:sugar ABC transporter ATP-binding protein [Halanaerobiales bacterium]